MPENIKDESVVMTEPFEHDPGPTPEQIEKWERERAAAWDAEIAPYRALKEQIAEHDDLMAETLYEITLLQIGMEV